MATAKENLSKKLQELSGWRDIGRKDGIEQYTLDFLLHQLQKTPNIVGLTLYDEGHYSWRIVASVHRVIYQATKDTPANAACELIIKLFLAGILKRI